MGWAIFYVIIFIMFVSGLLQQQKGKTVMDQLESELASIPRSKKVQLRVKDEIYKLNPSCSANIIALLRKHNYIVEVKYTKNGKKRNKLDRAINSGGGVELP